MKIMPEEIRLPKKESKHKSKGIILPTRFEREIKELNIERRKGYESLNSSQSILLLGDIQGIGKTYISLKLSSENYQHTLVLMNTHELCIEWINIVEERFGVYKINYPISRVYKLTEEHKTFIKYYFPAIKEDFNYMCKKCEDEKIRRAFSLGYMPNNCCKECEYRVEKISYEHERIICPYEHFRLELFKGYDKKIELHKRMDFLVKAFLKTDIIKGMSKGYLKIKEEGSDKPKKYKIDKFDNIVFDENFIELLIDTISFESFNSIRRYIDFYDRIIREYKGKENLKDIWSHIKEILMIIKETNKYLDLKYKKRFKIEKVVSIKEKDINNSIFQLYNKFKLKELIDWNENMKKIILENPRRVKKMVVNYFAVLLPIIEEVYKIANERYKLYKEKAEIFLKEKEAKEIALRTKYTRELIKTRREESRKRVIGKYTSDTLIEMKKRGCVDNNDLVYSYTISTRDIIVNLMKMAKKIIINCSTLTKELFEKLLPEYKDKVIFVKRDDLEHKFHKIIIYDKGEYGAFLKYTLYNDLTNEFTKSFFNLLDVLKGYIYEYRDKKILIVSFKVIERKLIKELEKFFKEYSIKNVEFDHWYNLESTNKYEYIEVLIQFGAPGISGRQMEIHSDLLNLSIEEIKNYYVTQQQYQVAERLRTLKYPNLKTVIFLTNEVRIEEFKGCIIERKGKYIEYKYIDFLKKLSEGTDFTIKECLDIYNSCEIYKKIRRDSMSKILNKLVREGVLIQFNKKSLSDKGRPSKVFNLPLIKKSSLLK